MKRILLATLLAACSSEPAPAPDVSQGATAGAAGAEGQAGGPGAGGWRPLPDPEGSSGAAGDVSSGAGGQGGGGAPSTLPGALGDACNVPEDCEKLHKSVGLDYLKCLRPKGWPSGAPGFCTFFCDNASGFNSQEPPNAKQICATLSGNGCAEPMPQGLTVCVPIGGIPKP